MNNQIYINLPVRDVAASTEFYRKLGLAQNPQFSNENASCMAASDTLFVMLLAEPFFKTFTSKAICDAKTSTEALFCLGCDSRAEVAELVRKAVAAGGSTYNEPQDHGFMYQHGFEDLDGHIWELVFMEAGAGCPDCEPAAAAQG